MSKARADARIYGLMVSALRKECSLQRGVALGGIAGVTALLPRNGRQYGTSTSSPAVSATWRCERDLCLGGSSVACNQVALPPGVKAALPGAAYARGRA